MPRQRRQKSSTDVYHVISRGNNKQHMLADGSDKRYYIGVMRKRPLSTVLKYMPIVLCQITFI